MKILLQKKIIKCLLLCSLAFGCVNTHAQSWGYVGNQYISSGTIGYPSLVIDRNGIPYLAYANWNSSGEAAVMKYNGSSWVAVGDTVISTGEADYISLAIDSSSGTPYIAFQDWSDSQKATVMEYNGSSWTVVGTPGFSVGAAYNISLAIDGSGTPYMAYTEGGTVGEAMVMKYNGSSWVMVGGAGISAAGADFTSLAIDGNGIPYVAYTDWSNGGQSTVMKYTGGSWVTVGSAGFSSGVANFISLAIDKNATPYMAYSDADNGEVATVMKFNGSNWTALGGAGFSAGEANFTAIAIDTGGTPYVVYQNGIPGSDNKATVMKYDGTTWTAVGSPDFSDSEASYTCLAIDNNGIPYIGYEDGSGQEATVMEYGYNTGVPNQSIATQRVSVTLFPNPATNEVTINYNAQDAANASLSIIDIAGQAVITQDMGEKQSGTVAIPVAQLPAGIYTIQFTWGSEVVRQKFVKQ